MPPSHYAFFDVDETLISVKSMFSFAERFCGERDLPDGHRRLQRLRELAARARAGLEDREALNLAYYRAFVAGLDVAELEHQGRRWFEAERRHASFFIESSLVRARHHQRQGGAVVLVSGSFRALLEPIAEHVGACATLCTELEIRSGRYTGDVTERCIGRHKARRMLRYLEQHAVPPERCFAYADDASDEDMLRAVGYPVVVGDDSTLVGIAKRESWNILTTKTLSAGAHPTASR